MIFRVTNIISLFILLGLEPASGISRLAFSRPGGMMRIPVSSVARSPYLFSAGFVSEMVSFSPYNSATGVYFDSEFSRNFRLGLSSVSTADTSSNLENFPSDPPLEVGLHLQRRLWTYGNISFALGVHDIVLTREESKFTIKPDLISYLGVISSEQQVGSFSLNTYMGFGTGTLAGTQTVETDSASSFSLGESGADTTSGMKLGVFAGFILKTPLLADRGGLDILAEFDGSGLNLGVRIPITSNYRLQVGLVHIENLPDFGRQSESMPLLPDASAIVLGLDLTVVRPKVRSSDRDQGPRSRTFSSEMPAKKRQYDDSTTVINLTQEKMLTLPPSDTDSGSSQATLAILDFKGVGISEQEALILTIRLGTFLVQSGEYRVIEREQMQQILEEQDFQNTGCTSNECAVEVGQLIGAQYMLAGSFGKIESIYTIDMRIIDIETGSILNTASYDLLGSLSDLLQEGLFEAVQRIIGN